MVRIVRSVASSTPYTEEALKRFYNRPEVKSAGDFVQITGRRYTIFESKSDPDSRRVGIYLRGGCDLPAIYGIAPLMRDGLVGSYAIKRDPIEISGSRSDLLLQALDGIDAPAEALREVTERLNIKERSFSADLFEPTFTVPRRKGVESYEKSVIVLSAGSDLTRAVYRHREYGFLVDPGGFWLNHSIDNVLKDFETVQWFNQTFVSTGRLQPSGFFESFGRLVAELKARTGATILVFNVLAVDPSDTTHSYRLIKNADSMRRREFDIALAELSKAHDFDVIDVDRILKLGGIHEQVDFAHPSEQQFAPLAREAHRILADRGIV
jgi:hypothetical protein